MGTEVKITLSTDTSIKVESTFKELNARGFVRGVTVLDQWFLLVNEGWEKTHLPMNEVVRDYLVTMLHRNSGNTALLERLSAFNYAEYLFGKQRFDSACINDVADMCLQSAALFPEYNMRRHEMKSYSYTVELGNSLYQQLAKESSDKDDWFSKAYDAMAKSFGQAIMVLRSTCPRFVNIGIKGKQINEMQLLYLESAQTESSAVQ